MSQDSSLYLNTRATSKQVRARLLELEGFELGEDFDQDFVAIGEGVLVNVYSPPLAGNVLRDAGISATVKAYIACTDNRLTYEWTLNTVRAVIALLHAYPGDALFMYCSDSPALLRKDGRIILDREAGLWDDGVEPDVLSLVDLPYEWGTIPVR